MILELGTHLPNYRYSDNLDQRCRLIDFQVLLNKRLSGYRYFGRWHFNQCEYVPPPNVRTIVTHQIIVDFLVHRFKLMSLNERTSLTSWSIIEIAMVEGITNNNEKMICILRKWFRSPLIIGECVNQLKINDITFQKRSRFV